MQHARAACAAEDRRPHRSTPPASYLWQVEQRVDKGATPEDLIGVLGHRTAGQLEPKTVAAAPELMVAQAWLRRRVGQAGRLTQ
jgi:hypothetical protein